MRSRTACSPPVRAGWRVRVGALVFLAPDASAFVNGQGLYVDGGMTAVV